MSDMRKALKQAGVVSDKQARQAAHADRVHRKELGEEGLAAERERRDETLREEQAQAKRAAAEREREVHAQKGAESRRLRMAQLVRAHDLGAQEAGPHRFYFALADGEIAFVDVSDSLARRLTQGDAAIIDGVGLLDRDFGVISGKIAAELEAIERTRIVLWNARG
jgi:uncharacterized protein YaiL (DUF2058 family)